MRKGELTTAPLLPVLRSLADDAVTGCLHVVDPEDREARVYLRSGCIYSVNVPGRWRRLGARLVSSGELAPDALAEALEVQRTELQGWRLGELLVYLGFIDQGVIERIVGEQLRDAVWDLLGWQSGTWRFRQEEATRDELVPPTSVEELVDSLQQRSTTWGEICTVVPGPWVVPMLATRGGAAEMALDADAWSLLCKVDGRRTVGELAYECGHTLFEAGRVLLRLMEAGLVEFSDGRPREEDTDFGTSLARVSQALANVLGPAPDASPDPYAVPAELRRQPAAAATVSDDEDRRRQQQIRAAAAAELAAAHAMAEAMHHQALEEVAAHRVDTEPLAPVISLVPGQAAGAEEPTDVAADRIPEPFDDEAPAEPAGAALDEVAEETSRAATGDVTDDVAQESGQEATDEPPTFDSFEVEDSWATELVEPVDPVEPVDTVEDVDLVEPVDTADDADWGEDVDPVESVDTVEDMDPDASLAAVQDFFDDTALEDDPSNDSAAENDDDGAVFDLAAFQEAAVEDMTVAEFADTYFTVGTPAPAPNPSALAEFAALAALDEPLVAAQSEEHSEPETAAELVLDEPQLSPDDLRQRAEQQSAAAALLSELAAREPVDEPTPAPEHDAHDAHDEFEPSAARTVEPPPARPAVDREHTDTAALLRELSSLGIDDEPAPAPTPARVAPQQRTATTADRKTKKRGFFGL